MKNLMMFLGAVLLCSAAACSSSSAASEAASGNCPSVGPGVCSADPAITQDEVNQCNTAKADATCGSKYTSYLECAGSNVKCGSDNKEDDSAVTANCASQFNAYFSCASAEQGGGDGGT